MFAIDISITVNKLLTFISDIPDLFQVVLSILTFICFSLTINFFLFCYIIFILEVILYPSGIDSTHKNKINFLRIKIQKIMG